MTTNHNNHRPFVCSENCSFIIIFVSYIPISVPFLVHRYTPYLLPPGAPLLYRSVGHRGVMKRYSTVLSLSVPIYRGIVSVAVAAGATTHNAGFVESRRLVQCSEIDAPPGWGTAENPATPPVTHILSTTTECGFRIALHKHIILPCALLLHLGPCSVPWLWPAWWFGVVVVVHRNWNRRMHKCYALLAHGEASWLDVAQGCV